MKPSDNPMLSWAEALQRYLIFHFWESTCQTFLSQEKHQSELACSWKECKHMAGKHERQFFSHSIAYRTCFIKVVVVVIELGPQ